MTSHQRKLKKWDDECSVSQIAWRHFFISCSKLPIIFQCLKKTQILFQTKIPFYLKFRAVFVPTFSLHLNQSNQKYSQFSILLYYFSFFFRFQNKKKTFPNFIICVCLNQWFSAFFWLATHISEIYFWWHILVTKFLV